MTPNEATWRCGEWTIHVHVPRIDVTEGPQWGVDGDGRPWCTPGDAARRYIPGLPEITVLRSTAGVESTYVPTTAAAAQAVIGAVDQSDAAALRDLTDSGELELIMEVRSI